MYGVMRDKSMPVCFDPKSYVVICGICRRLYSHWLYIFSTVINIFSQDQYVSKLSQGSDKLSSLEFIGLALIKLFSSRNSLNP